MHAHKKLALMRMRVRDASPCLYILASSISLFPSNTLVAPSLHKTIITDHNQKISMVLFMTSLLIKFDSVTRCIANIHFTEDRH